MLNENGICLFLSVVVHVLDLFISLKLAIPQLVSSVLSSELSCSLNKLVLVFENALVNVSSSFSVDLVFALFSSSPPFSLPDGVAPELLNPERFFLLSARVFYRFIFLNSFSNLIDGVLFLESFSNKVLTLTLYTLYSFRKACILCSLSLASSGIYGLVIIPFALEGDKASLKIVSWVLSLRFKKVLLGLPLRFFCEVFKVC